MEIWKELHLRALTTVTKNDAIFLSRFRLKIPRYEKCRCREFWDKYLLGNPPKYGNEYFAWTVQVHNAVNAKLGKKQYTVEEARALYRDDIRR